MWSNLEKRITAHVSKDKNLVRLFEEKLDGHGLIATLIFPHLADVHPNKVKKEYPHERQIAKGIGFAMDYGGSEFTVSKNLKIPKETAREYIDNYFKGFDGLAKFMTEQKQFARKNGFVQTLMGHKRHLSGIRSDNMRIKSYYERIALNAPIQGSAAEVAILAQNMIDKDPVMKALGCTMRIQIHDEIVCVAPRRFATYCMLRLKHIMESCLPHKLIVPLISEVDKGECYSEAK